MKPFYTARRGKASAALRAAVTMRPEKSARCFNLRERFGQANGVQGIELGRAIIIAAAAQKRKTAKPMVTFAASILDLAANDNRLRSIIFEAIEVPMMIGVLAREKQAAQKISISVEALVLPEIVEHGDRFENVLDYDRIHAGILALARGPHINLQETLAERVAELCLREPEIVAVAVHVRKLEAYADCVSVGIRILRTRHPWPIEAGA